VKRETGQVGLIIALLATTFCARAEVYDLPPEGQDVVGALTVVTARADDTLLDIARRHGLGYEDISRESRRRYLVAR
jgi:L,D-transpeptidase ErfK/SrfK